MRGHPFRVSLNYPRGASWAVQAIGVDGSTTLVREFTSRAKARRYAELLNAAHHQYLLEEV